MCIHIHTIFYTLLHVHTHTYILQTNIHTHTYKYTYITYYTCTIIYSFIHVYSCKHTYFMHTLHIHTYLHTYIHIYIYSLIHICIHYVHIHTQHTFILNITLKHSCFSDLDFCRLLLCSLLFSAHFRRRFFSLSLCPCFAATSVLVLPPPPLALSCCFSSPLFSVGAATTTQQIFYRYT